MNKEDQAVLMISGRILEELMEFDRFKEFVHMNYQIHKFLNEEDKQIEIKVIEEDSHHVQQRIMERMKEAAGEESGIVTAGADVLDKLRKT